MEESKRVVCKPTLIAFMLIAIPMVYTAFFQIDLWKEQLIEWGGNLQPGNVGKHVEEQTSLKFLLRRLVKGEDRIQLESAGFASVHDVHSDIYMSSKEVRIDTSALKVYTTSNQNLQQEEVQPYALKGDETAMKLVAPVQILHGNIAPPACHYIHDEPAIVFSSGGFAGNIFHEINDIIIPLFITSHHFRSNVRFVVTDFQFWFIDRYSQVISRLSRYEVIDAPGNGNGSVHCFPGAVVGLKYQGNLALNASDIPGGYSMSEFRQFITESFNLKIKDVAQVEEPVLLLLSRPKVRMILNQDEVVDMMKGIGYKVVIATPDNMLSLDKFVHVVNSCSVMVGVHGAGLTNELFLPNGAVMIQVVPLALDWAANAYYGGPAHDMGVQYLEYKIEPEESSLYDLYGPNHAVIANPESVGSKGYRAFREVYLDQQNVKINVARFRKILLEAMRLTGHSAASLN